MRANAHTNYSTLALALSLTGVLLSARCLAGVCPYGTTLPGVDVSHYQGTINWASVRTAGIMFAYAKATEGITYTDPLFATNWSAMKAAGVVRGAYLYFHSNDDPIAEADHFLSVVGSIQAGDLPPMLDVEVTDSQTPAVIAATLNTCAARLQAVTGRVPVIYTSPSFWTGSVGSTGFSGLPLWIANWGVTCPSMPVGWTNWAIWQYSDAGTVNGITGAVDLDEFNGTMSDMLAFTGLPSLSIAPVGPNQVALTWSTFAAGFLLQQNPDVGSTNWVNMTNAPVVVNNQEQVTVGTSGQGAFFRLVHP
jgi:lysozyme